ncbi:cytochrome c3 family protein [Candidatus Saganbacteria bacterium]|nr:cytochrome c3 family protein [Candidatus Saganbacteria bacterium]
MKLNNYAGFVAVGLVFLLSEAALAGIAGSSHDFRGAVSDVRTRLNNPTEICKVCHIPHSTASGSYLNPASRISAGAVTLHGGSMATPANSSAVCLSCHDGSVASRVGASSTDYSTTHPFLVTYPSGAGFRPAVGGNVTGASGSLPLEGAARNRVECGTCHNPHERGAGSKFLRIENTNSNLCLTCHQK